MRSHSYYNSILARLAIGLAKRLFHRVKIFIKNSTKKVCMSKNKLHLLRFLKIKSKSILAEQIEPCFYVRVFED